jgi:hypothetical protein
LSALIPADSLVAYVAKPYGWFEPAPGQTTTGPDDQPSAVNSIASIVAFLNASGLIPDEGQVFADIASSLPLLGRFEHALVLLDVSSRVVERKVQTDQIEELVKGLSLRLNKMQSAVIFRARNDRGLIVEQINRIVGRYTNSTVAKLSTHTIAGHTFQRLVDDRLPGWASWEWGSIGQFYVICFGEGSFSTVAETFAGKRPSLSADGWFTDALTTTQGQDSLAYWYIAMERLQSGLGTAAAKRMTRVTSALQADNLTHDLWTIGQEGRALRWYRCYRRDGQNVVRRYSDPSHFPPHHSGIIPDEARHVAVINVPTRWLVDNLPRGWLEAQSESNRTKWKRAWKRVEQEAGVDIGGSLIKHLGEYVVAFDFPPHPLHIPFALTLAIEIDDAKAVRRAIDALLTAWSQYLDERAELVGTTLVRVKVRRAEDGVWFLQAGILGPALKVTDGYIVMSWSPTALREAVRMIESKSRAGRQ